MNIGVILREEICKFLIKENLNNLTGVSNKIYNIVTKLYNLVGKLNDATAKDQMTKFVEYVFQIIHAVNRCVNKNSLNENLPPVLGGNIPNHFRRGFYGTSNFVDGIMMNMRNQYDRFKEGALKAVPLAQLLTDIENKENACNQLFSNNQELASNVQIQQLTRNIILNLKQLRTAYQQLVQQQGQSQQQQGQQQP